MSKTIKKKAVRKTASATAKTRWTAVVIFALAVLLYANTFSHGYVLDDDLVCAKNQYVQDGIGSLGKIFSHSWYHGFTGVEDRYYRPMMLASLALDNALFGQNSHHVINVLIYALSCAGLYMLWVYLLGGSWTWVPLVAVAMFTAHPLHTEVVANIKSRDELLSLFFLVGLLWGVVKGARESAALGWVVAGVSYVMALFTKESALTFLGLIPLTLYFFTNANWKTIGLATALAGIVALAFLLLRSQIVLADPTPFTITDNGLLAIPSKSMQLSTAVSMVGRYFYLLVWPATLSFDYSYHQIPEVSWVHGSTLASLAVIVALAYVAIKGWRNKSLPAYAVFWFAITFAVTANILFISGATFAERFMFIPSFAFCLALAWAGETLLGRATEKYFTLAAGLMVMMLIGYTVRTVTRNADWKSDYTLFTTGIKTSPNSSRAHSFYGKSRYDLALTATPTEKSKLLEEAIQHFKHSLTIHPGFNETYHHLAQALETAGRTPEAITAYEQAFQVDTAYFPAMVNVGAIYYNQGNYGQAVSVLERAWRLRPDHLMINRNLGHAYQHNKQYAEATERFKHALVLEKSEENLGNLVNLYRELGQIDTAIFYDQQIKAMRGELR